MEGNVHFYGNGSFPDVVSPGHHEYGREVMGRLTHGSQIPQELWGTGERLNCSDRERERLRQWDHEHLLPYVHVRSEHLVCRAHELGDVRHLRYCACAAGRVEGQAPGVAKVTHTLSYTVFACWDYTGDKRGNSWALFWAKGRLSSNDMVAAIIRDFPRLWARITRPFGMVIVHDQGPDPGPNPDVIDYSIPDEFFERIKTQATHESMYGQKSELSFEKDVLWPTEPKLGVGREALLERKR